MPRPMKWRMVCCMPARSRFGPLGATDGAEAAVRMTVDEYEAIRLIDLEDFTQEACAAQMNVARTTVQGIYNDARKKLADALVNGRELLIEGGEFRLCESREDFCRCGGFYKHRCRREADGPQTRDAASDGEVK